MSKSVVKDIYEFSQIQKKQISVKVSFPYGTKYLSNVSLIYEERKSDETKSALREENLNYHAVNEKLFCYSCNTTFRDVQDMRKHQWSKTHLIKRGFVKASNDNVDSDGSDEEIDTIYDEKLFEEEFEVENDQESDDDVEEDETNDKCGDNIDNSESVNIEESLNYDYITALKTGTFSFNEVCTFPTVYFQNERSEIIGIKRCFLFNKRNKPETVTELGNCVQYLMECKKLAVFLYSGGCFAGAIFDGNKQILHKSFKRYTYRRQQGGSQTTRDNQNGLCKSGGAYLRRVNTQKLIDDVNQLLHETWAPEIRQCGLILVWSAKCQRHIFGTPESIVNRNHPNRKLSFDVTKDPRVRFISARVSKVNSSTLIEVFRQVSTLEIFDVGSINNFIQQQIDRRESINVNKETECTEQPISSNNKKPRRKKADRKEEKSEIRSKKVDVELPESSQTDESGNDNTDPIVIPQTKEEDVIRTKLLNYVLNDSAEDLVPYIGELRLSRSNEEISALLSIPLKTRNQSLLHLAVSHNNNSVIPHLLESGCDPTNRNVDEETPYAQAIRQRNKIACNVMSEYMFKNPNQYDYHAAKFPGGKDPIKEEQKRKQLAEKKKQYKKDRKQRLKLEEEERKKLAAEKCERDQFLSLDNVSKINHLKQVERDQKKRFLLCFQCALDISCVVPFSYSDFFFCGMDCLKKHRIDNTK